VSVLRWYAQKAIRLQQVQAATQKGKLAKMKCKLLRAFLVLCIIGYWSLLAMATAALLPSLSDTPWLIIPFSGLLLSGCLLVFVYGSCSTVRDGTYFNKGEKNVKNHDNPK
jgi:hypothetical protein